jgi:hypothetical protein
MASVRNYDRANKRVMTSAIDSMSVADVRKFLGECRKKYTSQTHENPMYLTDTLTNGMQLQEFALKFQQGHHQKRHNKSRKHNLNDEESSSENEEDDYYDTYNCSESDDDRTTSPNTQQSKNSQSNHPTLNSNSIGLSNSLVTVITKKRGRPSKNDQENSEKTPRENSQHHSRSLMEFVKKPSKKVKRI